MAMTHLDRAQVYTDKALALLDAGFNAKARQKEANNKLNRAYDALCEVIREDVRATYAPGRDHSEEQWSAYVDKLNEYDLPFDLHNLRDRHIAKARELNDDIANRMVFLVETRAAVKAEPIQRVEPKAPSAYQVRAEKALAELIEKRKAQYLEAVELGRVFEGLPVSANTHWVINQYGTGFLRTYYYLNGKLTPLGVIIAAAETLARENAAA